MISQVMVSLFLFGLAIGLMTLAVGAADVISAVDHPGAVLTIADGINS